MDSDKKIVLINGDLVKKYKSSTEIMLDYMNNKQDFNETLNPNQMIKPATKNVNLSSKLGTENNLPPYVISDSRIVIDVLDKVIIGLLWASVVVLVAVIIAIITMTVYSYNNLYLFSTASYGVVYALLIYSVLLIIICLFWYWYRRKKRNSKIE